MPIESLQLRKFRHVNGGGLVVCYEDQHVRQGHVSSDSYVCPGSIVKGDSTVLSSSLIKTTVHESVLGQTVSTSSVIANCLLHETVVKNVLLRNVVVGNADLIGPWMLEGIARIPEGVWTRPPRFQLISGDNGVEVGLTEGITKNGQKHALMACWNKPVRQWLHAGPRLGRLHGWTAEQVETARVFFQSLLDDPMGA